MFNLLAASSQTCEWYAIRTKSRFEKTVAMSVRAKGYEVLLPLYRDPRRWGGRNCEVELPLFSGYVFASFDPRRRLPILQTPGVVQIVGAQEGPWPMDSREIENIGRVVELNILATPWPFLSPGEVVEITRGPLAGIQGTFVRRKNGHRLILSVSLLQRAIAVEVDVSITKPRSLRRLQSEMTLSTA